MQSKIEYIANHCGIKHQLLKLVEEMKEVNEEITKLLNGTDDKVILDVYRNTLPEELADLSVIYDQVIYLMDCKAKVEAVREYKATKEIRRIRIEEN